MFLTGEHFPGLEELESRVTKLEALVKNIGISFDGICDALDLSGRHCCVNKDYGKMYCATDSSATILGIDTSNGAGYCDRSNESGVCINDDE